MKQENLIIIASQPRSGSTLLQRLIFSNSKVHTLPETWFLLDLLGSRRTDLVQAEFNNELTQKALGNTIQTMGLEKHIDLTREYILGFYCNLLKGGEYFVDKTPRYYEILEDIQLYLPKSHKICLVRHPLDVLDSIIRMWVKNKSNLGHFYRDICIAPLSIMEWVQQGNAGNVMIRYEDVVSNQSEVITKLENFLGMRFDPENFRPSSTTTLHGAFGDKGEMQKEEQIVNRQIGEWKSRKKSKWWNYFLGYAHFLGPEFFEYYGYEYPETAKPTPEFNEFLRLGENKLFDIDVSRAFTGKIKARMLRWGVNTSRDISKRNKT